MHFWNNILQTAGMGGAFPWMIIGTLGAAAALHFLRPRERARVSGAAILFALSLIGTLAGSAVLYFAEPAHPAFVTIRGIAQFMQAVAIINLTAVFIFAVALSAMRLETPRIVQDLLIGIAYVITALVVLSGSGIDLRGIVATSAVMTAVIGFSLQDTLGNIMAGMAVQMDRTIRAGDWIRVGDLEGQVTEIRWRHTSIETRDWDTVVIPNSALMKGTVTILGRRRAAPCQTRRWVRFHVDFRWSPTEVIGTVESALLAESMPGVATDPQPHCILTALTDSYATYAARYWLTDLLRGDPTDSSVRVRIFAALRRADIPLSMPAHAVFVTEDDDSHRERKLAAQTQRHLEALGTISLFRSLTEDERTQLAPRLKGAPFVKGEALTRQGAQAHWLYIIASGEVDVNIAVSGQTRHIATLHTGDYFGEMGMMTGEPRAATVTAKTDVKCYRLGKEDFQDIVSRRPEILEDIATTLAERRVGLLAALENLTAAAKRDREQKTKHDLLSRIRLFFQLESSV